jgi:hypothetical protein
MKRHFDDIKNLLNDINTKTTAKVKVKRKRIYGKEDTFTYEYTITIGGVVVVIDKGFGEAYGFLKGVQMYLANRAQGRDVETLNNDVLEALGMNDELKSLLGRAKVKMKKAGKLAAAWKKENKVLLDHYASQNGELLITKGQYEDLEKEKVTLENRNTALEQQIDELKVERDKIAQDLAVAEYRAAIKDKVAVPKAGEIHDVLSKAMVLISGGLFSVNNEEYQKKAMAWAKSLIFCISRDEIRPVQSSDNTMFMKFSISRELDNELLEVLRNRYIRRIQMAIIINQEKGRSISLF